MEYDNNDVDFGIGIGVYIPNDCSHFESFLLPNQSIRLVHLTLVHQRRCLKDIVIFEIFD